MGFSKDHNNRENAQETKSNGQNLETTEQNTAQKSIVPPPINIVTATPLKENIKDTADTENPNGCGVNNGGASGFYENVAKQKIITSESDLINIKSSNGQSFEDQNQNKNTNSETFNFKETRNQPDGKEINNGTERFQLEHDTNESIKDDKIQEKSFFKLDISNDNVQKDTETSKDFDTFNLNQSK